MNMKKKTLKLGQKFGLWEVIAEMEPDKLGLTQYVCKCVCGKIKPVLATELRRGHSLGCRRCGNTTHGHSCSGIHSPEYISYSAAKERCNNERATDFDIYGGRGIKFLFTSFEQFLAELGARPKGTTVDRYPNNNGNYEPGNVRWATPTEQNNNRRKRKCSVEKERNSNGTFKTVLQD